MAPSTPETPAALRRRAARHTPSRCRTTRWNARAADLPAAVELILVQSDLTAILPGRPAPELAALLERTSVVESRGGALTVRFTPESVRGALDVGYRAEEITQERGRYSPAPLPDALSVLIQDAARHHGAVRVRHESQQDLSLKHNTPSRLIA